MSESTDLLQKLKVSVGGEPCTFQQLSSNNFIVGDDGIGFEAPGVGGFSVQHLYSGHVVRELPLKPLRGRPGFQTTLMRGRNIFRLEPEGLEFSLFYKSALRDWTESIIKAFIILLVIQTFVVQTFFIPTGSMKNTLFPGDYIMVEKLTFRTQAPDPGEIVVFEYPDDTSKDFIKRLIGVGGDRLVVHGGVVARNGRKLPEPYTVFKKRLYDPSLQATPPEIGFDLRPILQWPRQNGCQLSYAVSLTPRLKALDDLKVDSIEQAEVALEPLASVAEVEKKAGSYFVDQKTLELTIHPKGDVSLNAAAREFDLYFRFTHRDAEPIAELEKDVFGETMQAEDRPIELEPDQLWAMGDNRNNSADSRFWRNSLRRPGLMGKALLVYWPPKHMGIIRHQHLGR